MRLWFRFLPLLGRLSHVGATVTVNQVLVQTVCWSTLLLIIPLSPLFPRDLCPLAEDPLARGLEVDTVALACDGETLAFSYEPGRHVAVLPCLMTSRVHVPFVAPLRNLQFT